MQQTAPPLSQTFGYVVLSVGTTLFHGSDKDIAIISGKDFLFCTPPSNHTLVDRYAHWYKITVTTELRLLCTMSEPKNKFEGNPKSPLESRCRFLELWQNMNPAQERRKLLDVKEKPVVMKPFVDDLRIQGHRGLWNFVERNCYENCEVVLFNPQIDVQIQLVTKEDAKSNLDYRSSLFITYPISGKQYLLKDLLQPFDEALRKYDQGSAPRHKNL